MNTQQTGKASTSNQAYWAQVVVLGLVVGLSLQFSQAWTNAPGAPTGGNVSGPITTSAVAQTKTGTLSILDSFNVTKNATLGNFVSVRQTTGLCLGAAGSEVCKKSWDEVAVPSKAVMAFNSANCPAGWVPYARAEGRNIIGLDAGSPTLNALQNVGGRESVLLQSTQIPASDHYHNILRNVIVDKGDGLGDNDRPWNANNLYLSDETNIGGDTEYDLQPQASAPNVGRTSTALVPSLRTPVPLMDPYVVLLYCMKS